MWHLLTIKLKRNVDGFSHFFEWVFIWSYYLGVLFFDLLLFNLKSEVWDFNLCKYKNYLSAILQNT